MWVLILISPMAMWYGEVEGSHYLPGVAPHSYGNRDIIPIRVNSLTSSNTVEPMWYYDLPFCEPDVIRETHENLGEILAGDRIETSAYEIRAGVTEQCKTLCARSLTGNQVRVLSSAIENEYRVNLLLDNLPVGIRVEGRSSQAAVGNMNDFNGILRPGYPLGKHPQGENGEESHVLLYNHVQFNILYEEADDEGGVRVIGFEARPRSIDHELQADGQSVLDEEACDQSAGQRPLELQRNVDAGAATTTKVVFTYSVTWERTEVRWGDRWDLYLRTTAVQAHWFSIISSSVVVLLLTGIVAWIMLRAVSADFRKYLDRERTVESQEETGWKVVQADVFRAPRRSLELAALVGSGLQILGVTAVILGFALLGVLTPANRGSLVSSAFVFYVCMGGAAGFYGARLYKSFNGTEWNKLTVLTAVGYPAFAFAIFTGLNVVLFFLHSAGFVPLLTVTSIIMSWLCVDVPLVAIGSYFGFRKPIEDPPSRIGMTPRIIPPQEWYLRPVLVVLMGGVLPFGVVFVELYFIFSSIWLHQYYYLVGFLSVVFLLLVITSAEISIVTCYFQLCSANWKWQWRAFLTPAASGIYVFLYSCMYFTTTLHITKFSSVILYFGYSILMASAVSLLTGCVGYLAAHWFVYTIYGQIKID